MDINLELYKCFYYVATTLSFSEASRQLFISQSAVSQGIKSLEKKLGREPSVTELAEAAEISLEELNIVLEAGAEVESLHKTIYQGEGTELSLLDKIPEKENRQEKLLDKVLLEELLGRLEAEERKLIYMRYFQEMTQTEIARQLHISQVQVSRMEKRILKKLKKLL